MTEAKSTNSATPAEITAYLALGDAAGDKHDHEQQLAWFTLVYEQEPSNLAGVVGMAYSLEALGRAKEAFAMYLKAAELDPQQWNDVGACYVKGFGTPADESKGIACYERAVAAGNCMAMANLARRLIRGDGIAALHNKQDKRTVFRGLAWNLLGILKEQGRGGFDADPFAAIDCYRQASELGSANGAFNYGVSLFHYGTCDEERAMAMVQLLRAYARDPSDESPLVVLERRYREGDGVAQNATRAAEFAAKLALHRARQSSKSS